MTTPAPLGALRHRLTLERAATAADGSTTWTAAGTVLAAIEPRGGASAEAGGGLTGRVTHRIEMRWRSDVSSRDRLRLGDRIFRIHAARDLDERHARLIVEAEEENR
jgi:SPP1 family predicted phage head-tail adaptor